MHGRSICLGLMKDMQGEPWMNDGELICEAICPLINKTLLNTLEKHSLRFTWTSLQVNCDTVADWHKDSGNLGVSAMMVGGDFKGGEFEIENYPPFQLGNRVLFFDGTLWHRSHRFKGHRVSVVAFTHALTPKCPQNIADGLLELGFPFPSVLC